MADSVAEECLVEGAILEVVLVVAFLEVRLVDCLESVNIPWCAFGDLAVNHWSTDSLVTQDVDFIVAAETVEKAVAKLEAAGFRHERFRWSSYFKGRSRVSLQLSTEDF